MASNQPEQEQTEEEMAAERELADDAMWKIIQKNTFTRWANEHLKTAKLSVTNLEKDLSDGLKLIALIEVLSGKKFQKYNKKPTFRTQKFENVTVSLRFLEEQEGIKIVNIDSSDIVDQKLKLIMGLIWTLILHYSISMPAWDDEVPNSGKDQTPKQRLLAWIQSKIPEKNITNFTTDWNDGTAIAALVDALAPGLCPDWHSLDPKNKVPNAKEAMDAAEKWMDVPQLIKPDEMCNPKVDELSMMTYLSRFPNAKVKQGAPVQVKTNPARVKAYGPGLEPTGNVVGAPARFIVETAGAGKGDVEVVVLNPKGVAEKCQVIPNNDRLATFNCVYVPSVEGQYKVTIKFANVNIPKCPYLVNVGKPGDPGKVVVQGPGIEKTGVKANNKTYFEVITKGAGLGVVDVGIVDPKGAKDTIKPIITRKSDDLWYVEYTAFIPGLHSVNVFFAGKPTPLSPYAVGVSAAGGPAVDPSKLGKPQATTPLEAAIATQATPLKAAPGSSVPSGPDETDQPAAEPTKKPGGVQVLPTPAKQPGAPAPAAAQPQAKPAAPDAKLVYATGRGIQPKGVRVNEDADFKIFTEGAGGGNGEPKVLVMGPGGVSEKNTLTKVDNYYKCVYVPKKPGLYIVTVTYAGNQIQKSPFRVEVGPMKVSKIKAYGPGLETGVVGQPAQFTVEPNGEPGTIGFRIEGPSPAKIEPKKSPQGIFDVNYYPTEPGDYAVHILCNNDDIPKSPYMANIKPLGAAPAQPSGVDASKVTAYGPGLQERGVLVNTWAEFTVDATKAGGPAPLVVSAVDVDSKPVEVQVTDNKNGTYSVRYFPKRNVKHTITITYGGVSIPKSPYQVFVEAASNAGKVKVYGPAIEQPVKATYATYFIVDTKEAGPGDVKVTLTNEKGVNVPFKLVDNKDKTYRVEFEATTIGVYTATVTFATQATPGSPYKINVVSGVDLSKVQVKGLPENVPVNKEVQFEISFAGAGRGFPKAIISSPSGKPVPVTLTATKQDIVTGKFTPTEVGPQTVNITFADQPVPNSPFKVNATEVSNASKVRVYGPAVEAPVKTFLLTYLIVDAKEAGPGEVVVTLTNEQGISVPFKLIDNNDKTYRVEFEATTVGFYPLTINFASQPVPGSPYKIKVEAGIDLSKVQVKDLPENTPVGKEVVFSIDTAQAGPGQAKVNVTSPSGQVVPTSVEQKPDGFIGKFTPTEVGPQTINVTFADQPVPNSPFKVNATEAPNAAKVKVYGPAVEAPVKAFTLTYFIIDAKEAGTGDVNVTLTNEQGVSVPFKLIDNKDSTFRVEFEATVVGSYTTNVTFASQPTPGSPYKITVEAGVDASKVKVTDLPENAPVNKELVFSIDTSESGSGPVAVNVTSPSGQVVPSTVEPKPNGFTGKFTPTEVGPQSVNITFAEQPVPNSPFTVNATYDLSSKVKVKELPENAPVGQELVFSIDTTESGPGPVGLNVTSPSGQVVPSTVEPKPDGYTGKFTPTEVGPQSVNVTFFDQPVPNSPFTVNATSDISSKVKVKELPESAPVGQELVFSIDTTESGPGPVGVNVTSPSGLVVPSTVEPKPDGYTGKFTPTEVGPQSVNVTFSDQPVPNSPFKVNAVDVSKVKVKELPENTPVNKELVFSIDTSESGPGPVTVNVTSPSGQVVPSTVEPKPNGFTGKFTPTEAGPQTVNVTFVNQPVPNSPFKVNATDVSKVKVKELPENTPVGQEVAFTINTVEAGPGQAKVNVTTPSGKIVPASVEPKPEGFTGKFTPYEPGPQTVAVTYVDEPVPNSPFKVNAVGQPVQAPTVGDASKVKAYGAGLIKGTVNGPAEFTIDTREAGTGGLGLTIDGPVEAKIECFDKGGGLFDVKYFPTEPGEYVTNILFDDKPIPNSPFHAQINPAKMVDVSGVKVYGQGVQPTGVFLESTTDFTVDATSVVPKGEGKVKALIQSPTGVLTEAIVNNKQDGTYECLYTPFEQGPHKINVTYEGLKVPNSPFTAGVVPGNDPSRVKVYGPGIKGGQVNKPQKFTIETRGAGQGGIGLSVVGPTEPKIGCVDNHDGTLTVEYLPNSVGDYEIGVTFADQPVPGSPFQAKVTETAPEELNPAANVKVYGAGIQPKGVKKGQKAAFVVDATKAPVVAPVDVIVTDVTTGQKKPADIVPRGNGTYDVSYTPVAEGPTTIEVNYASQPVPNSPFTTQVEPSGADVSKVVLSGNGVKPQGVLASIPVSFTVDTRSAGPAPLDANVKGPHGELIKCLVQTLEEGVYEVQYTPEDVGTYTVDVKYGGQPLPSGPVFVTTAPTGNASQVKVPDNVPQFVNVDEESSITVKKYEAGYGKITCTTTSTTVKEVKTTVIDNNDGTVTIKYKPVVPGVYVLDIKYGGIPVPNGHITQQVGQPGQEEPVQAAKAPAQFAPAPSQPSEQTPFTGAEFVVPIGPDFSLVNATVTTPSLQKQKPKVVDNGNGTIKVNYQPTESGPHTLELDYAGVPLQGSPYKFIVQQVTPGQVYAFGPGLSSGLAGQPSSFTVVTKDAGPGALGLSIEGPSKAEIQCKDNKDGTCTITYTPTLPGEYKIVVKYGGQPVRGAPFYAKISAPFGEESNKSQVSLGTTNTMSLTVTETDLSNLTATIKRPSGIIEPCGLRRQPNGQLGISFTPTEIGEHWVSVFRNGEPIPKSPFKVVIGSNEIGNASKVRVGGRGLTQGQANELNEFFINTKDAGVGGLGLSIEGPGKVDIKCYENPGGTCRVAYKPTEPGTYQLAIKYADEHIPGSPFTVNVGGQPSGRVTERITRQQQALTQTTTVGTQCELNITMAGIDVNKIEGSVTSPSGVIEPVQIIDLGNNRFTIKFIPKELGVYTVSLKYNGLHIPGSPFQFTVGPIAGGGPHKVRAVGSGLERGEVNKPNPFTIITREAGAGALGIGIEGPSKAVIDFQDRKDGTSDVTYTVTEPGEYLVSVKFNDQHIPDSPFKVYILPAAGESKKLHVSDLQQLGLQVNTPTQFTVDFNGAQGRLEAKVVAPSGTETEATVQQVQNDRYVVNFVPRESGLHYVHVKLNGVYIPGSPYPVQVGQLNADPSLVSAYGDGLYKGQTGQLCKFIVNTSKAGPGALSVGITGPSKVELMTCEVEEGYEFTYTPLSPGDYLIVIKYAGTHVPGSPFKAQIEGPGAPASVRAESRMVIETVTKTTSTTTTRSQGATVTGVQPVQADASKVIASGEGLSKATVNQEASVLVDGSQTGYNALLVGIAGPLIPCEEIHVFHLGRLQYTVKYKLSQPGNYRLIVKWGDQHIPGSPFNIVAQ